MRFRLRLLAALTLSLSALVLTDGCSQQGEGDRCDSQANGDADCAPGLTCKAANLLQNGNDQTDRCCPTTPSTNARCAPATASGTEQDAGTAGSSGSGGSSGSAGGGGTAGSAGSGGAAGNSGSSGSGGNLDAGSDANPDGSAGSP
ncbi:MAG TPA: hypothetical protein VGI10_25685 [Polyangiaceae bacterium]|jgi:hypothetical protein